VVILGILAAIVIPQFTQASTEAKTNSQASDLQTLRSQIELFKVQHNDTAPALLTFASQMIYTSKLDGTASATKVRADPFNFGPYLERVPENPFNGSATVSDTAGATVGWLYDAATGEIHAGFGDASL
jgi:general secretion pathway protein G